MDVATPSLGRTPKFSHYSPPSGCACSSGCGCSSGVAAGGGGADPPEIAGSPDGPDIVLASGVHVRRMRIGTARVGALQLQQAIRGIQLLPFADQQLLARLGIPVELVPVIQLERLAHATAPVVGATRVTGPDGSARPERLRVAAYQARLGTSVLEATQHEIGHVVAVTTRQDTSEDAAIRYAATY